MSEEREMNGEDFSRDRLDVESILRRSLIDPPQVDRDELFFEAGFAAGNAQRHVKIFWPAAAAAMLLLSIGFGAALYQQIQSSGDLRRLLAAAQPSPRATAEIGANEHPGATAGLSSSVSGGTRTDDSTAGQASSGAPQQLAARSNFGRMLSDEHMRNWRRLASAEPLPPGKLTALGWEPAAEMGSGEWGMGNERSAAPPNSDESKMREDSRPRKPPTYLELMRRYQEG